MDFFWYLPLVRERVTLTDANHMAIRAGCLQSMLKGSMYVAPTISLSKEKGKGVSKLSCELSFLPLAGQTKIKNPILRFQYIYNYYIYISRNYDMKIVL
jgi:hypothetical protein